MRLLTGLALAGGLLLAQASTVNAQTNSLGSFGGYPAGITTGSAAPYDPFARGYFAEHYGYPYSYSYPVTPFYGSPYMASPGTSYYSSGYAGYTYPGAVTYGTWPRHAYPSPAYGAYYAPAGAAVYGYRPGLRYRTPSARWGW